MLKEPIDIYASSSRLVWVLNGDIKPYKGNFRGTPVVIPANREKIPLRAEKGGNLMPYLEARRFITDYKDPQDFVMDNYGKPQPVFGLKYLIDQELTVPEYETITGKSVTSADSKKAAIAVEKKAARELTKELGKRANKIAITEDEPGL